MKVTRIIFLLLLLIILGIATNKAVKTKQQDQIISWIDNQGYWTKLAAKGIVPYNRETIVPPSVYTGNAIRANTVLTRNSPDIPVAEEGSTQSENSVFIDQLDETRLVVSNNSATYPVDTAYGANSLYSFNSGTTWEGSIEGAGGFNNGDPSTVIGLNGRWYVNYLGTDFGIYVSYSDNEGEDWTVVDVANNPLIKCDKSHMCIDNNPDSPYEGNIYVSWTNTSDLDLGQIGVSVSTDGGNTWTLNSNVSADIDAGSHNQGVNITTGPNGEVYMIWAVYDSWQSGGSDEVALGFSRSLDGGTTWEPSRRVITNIKGIRATKTSKNMRVNSFPVATVDNSTGADRGALYLTWANVGYPGQNTGDDINIFIVKSFDGGDNFSEPRQVNSDEIGVGNEHFFPWITSDRNTGILSMIYYNDRNVGGTECEVFCANSIDGGQTWEEFKVSDVSFTPSPIPGLAADYMGDYLGISAHNGMVYPVWTDNRDGYARTYCSPYLTNPLQRPINLEGFVINETGQVDLIWEYEEAQGFAAFIVYRDGDSIASTTDTTFVDLLPDYGKYRYRVTAYYENDVESGATGVVLSWGAPKISVATISISDHLAIGQTSEHIIQVVNAGQLDLNYTISLNDTSVKYRDYCTATGGGGVGNEFISSVEIGSIENLNTGSDNYTYYSDLSTTLITGKSYEIVVTNGQPFDLDKCGVWVDWNINGVFEENELTVLSGQTLSPYFSGIISPPPGAITGTSRMRVRLQYSGDLNPCGTTYFGEVEDYPVELHGWMDIAPMADTISASDTSNIIVTFITENLPEDEFFTNIFINSNDEETPIIKIPVQLRTNFLTVEAFVSDTLVCPGTKITLQPSVTGNYDSLTFHWTSNPPGYSAYSARPPAIVIAPTWYIITVQDGDHTASDSIFVNTYPAPVTNLPSDTSVCADVELTLDAGDDGISYLWSTGDTSRYLYIDSTGTGIGSVYYSVDVVNEYECEVSDDVDISFVDCTDIDENKQNDLKIYPNPSSGIFTIESSFPNYTYKVSIINSQGSIVSTNFYHFRNTNKSDVVYHDISPGYYFIKIEVNNKIFVLDIIIR